MTRPAVLHGHFYQPPRENPWTGRVPLQPGAAPDHDWNVRISRECYEPLAEGGAFEWLSFDIGPTLLTWLQRERPAVLARIVEADRRSRARLGFGNALAQPYHHVILPLASRREKRTEMRWGVVDFERRFGRLPDGVWLPETAVDRETLDVLAEFEIAFTILAPHQLQGMPEDGGPAVIALDGGREIAVFAYHGAMSHGVAFGALLRDPDAWAGGILEALEEGREVVALAMDGETFGHHHRGAERTLMDIIVRLRADPRLELSNFASVLSGAGALEQASLVEPSSWSCSHGIERWRTECGCKVAPERPSQQAWRAPLREALDWLGDEFEAVYREYGARHLHDLAGAREQYGAVVSLEPEDRRAYARRVARAESDADEAAILLELSRHQGGMFTSCGWFFDDVAGLGAQQVLRYAAQGIDLVFRLDRERARVLEARLIERLAAAPSNDEEVRDAARLYATEIRGPHPLGSTDLSTSRAP